MAIQYSNTKVSVLDSSTTLLSSTGREKRLHAVITNDSDATVYLGVNETAVLNEGVPLAPGEKWILAQADMLNCSITAITAVTGKNVAIFEMYLDAV